VSSLATSFLLLSSPPSTTPWRMNVKWIAELTIPKPLPALLVSFVILPFKDDKRASSSSPPTPHILGLIDNLSFLHPPFASEKLASSIVWDQRDSCAT